jgi:hypothetical protein
MSRKSEMSKALQLVRERPVDESLAAPPRIVCI